MVGNFVVQNGSQLTLKQLHSQYVEVFWFILSESLGCGYHRFKAGVYMKAVFTPLKIGSTEISRSRFKQYKNPMLITQINVLGCCKFYGDF